MELAQNKVVKTSPTSEGNRLVRPYTSNRREDFGRVKSVLLAGGDLVLVQHGKGDSAIYDISELKSSRVKLDLRRNDRGLSDKVLKTLSKS